MMFFLLAAGTTRKDVGKVRPGNGLCYMLMGRGWILKTTVAVQLGQAHSLCGQIMKSCAPRVAS